MNNKKLFILGIDNNPKVWYNERGGCAGPRFSGFWREKFLCKLPIDKKLKVWYNRNFGPLGRWRADRPTFYYIIFERVLSIVKLNKKNKGETPPYFTYYC